MNLEKKRSEIIWRLDPLVRTYTLLQNRPLPYQLSFPGLICDLVNPPDILDGYYETPLGDVHLKLQSLVTEQFVREILWPNFRLENISKYPYWASLRKDRKLQPLIKPEAKLWVATWQLCAQLNALGLVVQHPTTIFRLLAEERSLIQFFLLPDRATASNAIKAWRHENGLLRTLGQPFSLELAPIAFRVIEAAQGLSERSQPFRRDYYNKVWVARVARVKVALSDSIAASLEGKFSLQGHRK